MKIYCSTRHHVLLLLLLVKLENDLINENDLKLDNLDEIVMDDC